MSSQYADERRDECPVGDPRAPSFWWVVAIAIGTPVAIAWILGALP